MKGILFDLDDTLYPRELYIQSGFEAVAGHVADSWRRSREGVLATLRRAHTSGFAREEFQVLCAEHRLPLSVIPMLLHTFRAHRPVIVLQPAVRTVLQQLRRDGWRIGILTNGDPGVQRRKVEALGLPALVDSITYADEHCESGKPHPSVFLIAVSRLRLRPTQCVHVGDDPICDVGGAHAVGLRTIRVLSPPDWSSPPSADDERAWQSSQADATVDTVLDVPTIAPLVLRCTDPAAYSGDEAPGSLGATGKKETPRVI
jgi:putative hydrolase of the HAD superfamily